jgi:hypothetical protein
MSLAYGLLMSSGGYQTRDKIRELSLVTGPWIGGGGVSEGGMDGSGVADGVGRIGSSGSFGRGRCVCEVIQDKNAGVEVGARSAFGGLIYTQFSHTIPVKSQINSPEQVSSPNPSTTQSDTASRLASA